MTRKQWRQSAQRKETVKRLNSMDAWNLMYERKVNTNKQQVSKTKKAEK